MKIVNLLHIYNTSILIHLAQRKQLHVSCIMYNSHLDLPDSLGVLIIVHLIPTPTSKSCQLSRKPVIRVTTSLGMPSSRLLGMPCRTTHFLLLSKLTLALQPFHVIKQLAVMVEVEL